MELWIGAINLGFLYAFMTMGVFITFRVHNFPDITVDGSFTSGAATAAILIASGINPWLSLAGAFVVGAIAGSITAFIHTRFNINGLLAGILVMTGLYSVNLHIMGRSNIPLLNRITFVSYLDSINPGLPSEIWICIVLVAAMVLFWLAVSLFFLTDMGISLRATGNNPNMAAATGVNVKGMTIFGVAMANALVGISGGLVAQYQGFADIGMGIGTIVIGLAAVIIGESLLKIRSIYAKVLSVIIGSVIFRMMIALALYAGMNPIDLKLLTAVFVLVTLVVSKSVSNRKNRKRWSFPLMSVTGSNKRLIVISSGMALVIAIMVFGYRQFFSPVTDSSRVYKVGFVQITDHGLLNITRDSFIEEMEKIGYRNGENSIISLENANGDLPTVNTILDKFRQEDVDIIVPVSTACTQAAINKIKHRPVVFATVANPFIIGAGKSDTEHLANVTGTYGAAPMDKLMTVVQKILPGKITVGTIWDLAHANSVFNVSNLKKTIESNPAVSFAGVTIASSSDVYQAAVYLAIKGIDAFVLSPDNIVYSAFESVVKAAKSRNIPIFMSDVERCADGALATIGYDYSISGIQAAHLVDRILQGENPADIPFEPYRKLTFGINLKTAKELGITISPELIAEATIIYGGPASATREITRNSSDRFATTPDEKTCKEKRLALFLFGDQSTLIEGANGVVDELRQNNILSEYCIKLDTKNAQNEFYIAQSIAQDIVMQQYDYIITLSTPALQVMANTNQKIPHVFGVVTDPYRMGVAETPNDHLSNVTGVATLQPVETCVKVMRELFPDAGRIGIVWNPAEACSETCTYKARKAAKRYGFELLEVNITSTSEVLDAVRSLLNKDIDLFLTSGDNTVIMALSSVAEIMKQHRIPYFTNTPSDIEQGAFICIGADYYEVGKETAKMAIRVINGEDPKDIPINNYVPEKLYVNLGLARQYGIDLPEEFLESASKIKR